MPEDLSNHLHTAISLRVAGTRPEIDYFIAHLESNRYRFSWNKRYYERRDKRNEYAVYLNFVKIPDWRHSHEDAPQPCPTDVVLGSIHVAEG